jgi:hypothetical protein
MFLVETLDGGDCWALLLFVVTVGRGLFGGRDVIVVGFVGDCVGVRVVLGMFGFLGDEEGVLWLICFGFFLVHVINIPICILQELSSLTGFLFFRPPMTPYDLLLLRGPKLQLGDLQFPGNHIVGFADGVGLLLHQAILAHVLLQLYLKLAVLLLQLTLSDIGGGTREYCKLYYIVLGV